ncbi:hypothetical protein P8610_11125 [Fictibacillus sp. UD]
MRDSCGTGGQVRHLRWLIACTKECEHLERKSTKSMSILVNFLL